MNAVSSYVTAFLFLLPLLRALAGASEPLPRPLCLPLAGPLPSVGERTEFVRARFAPSGLMPIAEQDSSALRALAAADALIERPAGAAAVDAGASVIAYSLEYCGMA